ncbi:MAG: hypothetical protein R6V67_05425 [Spirochaetia bacterium]
MNISIKKRLLVVLLILPIMGVLIPSVSALTLEEWRLRLELHEKSGRFSLFYLSDTEKDGYTPLFFERDPRTSSIGFLIDERVVIPGPSSGFDQSLERTTDGARFTWTSSELRITEDFRFIKSRQSGPADGVEIEVIVENKKGSALEAGLHFLLDTNLAEDGSTHFTISAGKNITGETEFTSPAAMPEYWLSPGDLEDSEGLQVMLKGPGITTPDRVVFANWKRLSDDLWDMETGSGRSFNLPPYSINDSAAAHFYDAARLSPGSSKKVSMALGAASGASFSISKDPSEAVSEDQKTGSDREEDTSLRSIRKTVSDAAEEKENPIEEDLMVINDILSNIDSLLSSPEEMSEEKIDLLEEALSTLEERKNTHDSSSN